MKEQLERKQGEEAATGGRRLRYFRVVMAATAVSYLLFGWMYKAYLPGSFPMSMTQRIGAALFFLALLSLTFLSTRAREKVVSLMYLGAAGAVFHLVYFAFLNNYQLNYALSLIIVIIVVNFLLPADGRLKWLNLAIFFGAGVSVFFVPEPTFNRWVYVISLASISVISYLLTNTKRRARREYERLFYDSPTGLVRADSEGEVQNFNKKLKEIVEPPSAEELSGLNIFDVLGYEGGGEESVENREKRIKFPWGNRLWVDYSVKPLNENPNTSSDVIIACRDVTERKEVEDRIEYMTYHDNLTGLYNRSFYEEIIEGFNSVGQYPLSVLFIDLDKLKLVNDAFGHKVGDELLTAAAEVIQGSCREEDLVFRWGGDEIIILLPNTEARERKKVRERILSNGQEAEFEPIELRFSIGGGTARWSQKKEKLDYLLQEAEEDMYERKLEKQEEVSREILAWIEERIEEKSDYVMQHSRRVEELARQLGEELGMEKEEVENLGKAARYHDIGKVAQDEQTLQKFYRDLTEEEKEELKTHCNIGYQIAKELRPLSGVASAILQHHEWWDGSGYPKGAAGEEIPYKARIISVVNAYDAKTAPQSNQEKRVPEKEAIDELKKMSGKMFDPSIVDSFLSLIRSPETG